MAASPLRPSIVDSSHLLTDNTVRIKSTPMVERTTMRMCPTMPIPVFLISTVVAGVLADHGSGIRVYDQGSRPKDQRLHDLKDLDGYFPFSPPDSLAAWRTRSSQVKRRILVANGLWPMPPRSEVSPTIHGRVERDDYSVDKVFFESYPGFYVTGSLFRPKGKSGPFPAVVSRKRASR